MSLVRRSPILALLLCAPLCAPLSLTACSSVDDAPFAEDTGAPADDALPLGDATPDSIAVESGPDAPPADVQPEAPSPTTLANVCPRLADAICAQPTKDCCTRRAIGYDAAGCSKAVNAWCGALVSQVKAAQRTFNAGEFDACARGWRELETTCSVPFVEYVTKYSSCAQLFPGTVAPGKACTDDTDCIAPVGGVAFCDESSKVCATATVAAKGASCSYSQSALVLCEAGAYCPTSGGATKCKASTAIGGACSGVNDPSCGMGNQCAQVSATSWQCRAGLPAAAKCTSGMQCASWQCDGLTPFGGSGTCSDPYAQMASPAICQGVP